MATVSSECASDNELLFPEYETDGFYDEMFEAEGNRGHAASPGGWSRSPRGSWCAGRRRPIWPC